MLHTFSFIAVLVVSTGTAWAQSGIPHTPAEEKACRDDAHRFCKNVLSDEFQVASACKSTAIASATPAARPCKATHDSPLIAAIRLP